MVILPFAQGEPFVCHISPSEPVRHDLIPYGIRRPGRRHEHIIGIQPGIFEILAHPGGVPLLLRRTEAVTKEKYRFFSIGDAKIILLPLEFRLEPDTPDPVVLKLPFGFHHQRLGLFPPGKGIPMENGNGGHIPAGLQIDDDGTAVQGIAVGKCTSVGNGCKIHDITSYLALYDSLC